MDRTFSASPSPGGQTPNGTHGGSSHELRAFTDGDLWRLDYSSDVMVGGTGMVGGYALGYALENSQVKGVTSIGRKRLGISHPKLNEVLHQNFADCSPLANVLSNQDAVVYLPQLTKQR